jgi:U6 snRNA-associated Sm-like protein LSm6
MNIALEEAKEYVDGKLHRSYGDAFIRGNNGKHLKLGLVLIEI